jgi:hypothetical protein
VQLPVAAAGYLLLNPAGSERDKSLGLYPQAKLLLDLPQTVQRLLPRRKVPRGGDVQVAGPGIFRGCAPLEQQVGPSGVGTADPTVKTTVSSSSTTRKRVASQHATRLRQAACQRVSFRREISSSLRQARRLNGKGFGRRHGAANRVTIVTS